MIQFVCDSCAMLKRPDDVWVLGLAAESHGVAAARREVTILSVWDRNRAVHPLAVHFCSLECKDNYLSALFGETSEEEVIERTVPVDSENIMERTMISPVVHNKRVRSGKRSEGKASKKSRPKNAA